MRARLGDAKARFGGVRARLVDTAFLVALLLVAAVPLWPVYEHPQLLIAVGGGMLIGGGVAVLGAWSRWPAYAVAGAAVVLVAVAGVPLAVPSAAAAGVLPTLDGFRMLADGAVFGWKDMLSVPLPLGDYEALLVPALLVVAAAATAGVSVVLRAPRPAWAMLAPGGVFVFALAFGGRQPLVPALTSAAFVSVALMWAARGFGAPVAGRARAGRLIAGVVLIAVSVGAGAGVAAIVPSPASRALARDAVEPPFDPRREVSPLVGYRNSVLPPGKDTVMLRVSGLPDGARIRLATLDDYDGRVFAVGAEPDARTSGVYQRIPLRVERDEAPAGEAASVSVTVEDYAGVWLPTAGALESIALPRAESGDFFYNTRAEAGALAGGVTPGLRYTMRTVVSDEPSDARIRSALPASQADAKREVPAAIADAVTEHAGDGTPGERLATLAEWLRQGSLSDGGADDPFSRSGHSIERLTELVSASPMLGDAEQYAPALALMARQVGFPSRVVVGYAPTSPTVTGADLTAWVEVRTSGGEWLAIDPTPPARDTPVEDRDSTEVNAQPQTVLPPPSPTSQDAVSADGSDGEEKKPGADTPEWQRMLAVALTVAGIVAGTLLVVLAPFWAPALVRGIQRRWRRGRDRRQGVLTGGWLQVRDRVAELGHPVPSAATRREIAAVAGAPEVADLAERADRAVFDAGSPSRADIDDYWMDVRTARSRLLREVGLLGRVRVLMSWRGILGKAHWTGRVPEGRRRWQ